VTYKHQNEDKTTTETKEYLRKKLTKKKSLWPIHTIHSKWINTMCPVKLKDGLAHNLAARDQHPEKHSILHIMQAILTPVTGTITKSLMPGARHKNLEDMARDLHDSVVQWIEAEWRDKDLNIVIIDHYKPSFVESIVKLNSRDAIPSPPSLSSLSSSSTTIEMKTPEGETAWSVTSTMVL